MEEILPPQTEHGAGFESTRVRQYTVFLENRVGRLQQLVRAYESASDRIVALSIQNSADTALVRLICSDPELGRDLLTQEGFSFTEQDLLVVALPGNKQPLLSICSAMLAAEINIHYVYPLLVRPALVLSVDEPILASQILIRKGFTLLAESDLRKRDDLTGE